MTERRRVFIVTGEHSGDLHAAGVVRELKKLCPNIEIQGIGGKHMEAEGVKLFRTHEKMGQIGVTPKAIIDHLKLQHDVIVHLEDHFIPDLVLLVDYGEFNLRLAKSLKKRGRTIFYYVSPQVWASRKGRINKIKKYVHKLMSIFPFEKEFYAKENYNNVEYVGHPLISTMPAGFDKEDFYKQNGLDINKKLIGIFPGSRKMELNQMMPVYEETIKEIFKTSKKVQFCICQADNISDELLEKQVKKLEWMGIPFKVIKGQNHALLACSDALILTSGTVTLEAALYQTPMVVCYKLPSWMYRVYLWARDIANIALPNIVAKREVVKELVQENATPEKISSEVLSLLHNSAKREEMVQNLKGIREEFGDKISSEEVAKIIRKYFEDSDIYKKNTTKRGKYRGLRIKEKTFFQQLKISAIGNLISSYLCTLDILFNKKIKGFNPEQGPAIYAIWHGWQYGMGIIERKYRKKINMLVSPSNDGEIICITLVNLGFSLIRGSKGRDGFQATQEILKSFENGESLAFTVDGPKGPSQKVKMGLLKLAQMGGVPIIPMVPALSFQLVIPSWDSYKVPLPGSKISCIFGEPIYVPKDATPEEMEEIRLKVENVMLGMESQAIEFVRGKNG